MRDIDSEERKRLIVDVVWKIQKKEGFHTTREQVEEAYDRWVEQKKRKERSPFCLGRSHSPIFCDQCVEDFCV